MFQGPLVSLASTCNDENAGSVELALNQVPLISFSLESLCYYSYTNLLLNDCQQLLNQVYRLLS